MNLTGLDWSIVTGLLTFLLVIVFFTKKHNRSVADFLAANRCAGRYVLSVSDGIVTLGAITVIAKFQMYYKAGFTATWWQMIELPIGIIIAVTGWVIYRYRQTRALTLAQFFEMRYSRRFRVFAGLIAFGAGIVNFGIFPAVGAKFFVFFCGFPAYLEVAGMQVSTFALTMIGLLALSLCFTFLGGQIAIIVTDFIQGMFCNLVFIVILVFLFSRFAWPDIVKGLEQAPAGMSRLNPFETKAVPDFNVWFFLILAFNRFYACMAWQGRQGYFCSAKNAHEAKMAMVLGTWRGIAMLLLMTLLPVAAFVVLHHPELADTASQVNSELAVLESDQVRSQMTVPGVLIHILPQGLVGALCAVMMAAFISTHDTYLHSWGSIFIQDVVMPFRKRPLSPKQHMMWLRASILAVAIFIFCFSLLFKQNEDILMYFQITGAIFTGGIGAVIIGGLYWKRGTTAAAWAGMITGSTLAVTAVILKQIHHAYPFEQSTLVYLASRTGAVLGFWSSICAIAVYVVVSLCGGTSHNMDRLLHRGPYAVAADQIGSAGTEPMRGFRALFTREFTRGDKIIYLTVIFWALVWFLLCLGGTLYHRLVGIDTTFWPGFWHFYVWLCLIIGAATTLWLSVGGLIDLRSMFSRLRTATRDQHDDGTVFHPDKNETEKLAAK